MLSPGKSPSQPTKKCLTETDIFHSVSSSVIASRLVNKERYPPALAMAVVGEYLRFLLLKALIEDWNDDILFPSPQVQLAWQQHILSTGSYVDECKSICGRILHHDPDGGLKRTRYARTLSEYERVFGIPPRESIWPPQNATELGNETLESAPISSTGPPSSSIPVTSFVGSSLSAVPTTWATSRLATSNSSASLHTSLSSRRSSRSDQAETNKRDRMVKRERTDVNVRVKEEKNGKDEYYSTLSQGEAARRAREPDRYRNYDDDNKYTSSSSSLRGTKRRAPSRDHGPNHNRRPTTSPECTFDILIVSSPSTFELSLNVTASTRISTVLQEYACRRRISPTHIQLMYYRDALDISKTVGYYSLRKGSVLRAVFASKGD